MCSKRFEGLLVEGLYSFVNLLSTVTMSRTVVILTWFESLQCAPIYKNPNVSGNAEEKAWAILKTASKDSFVVFYTLKFYNE